MKARTVVAKGKKGLIGDPGPELRLFVRGEEEKSQYGMSKKHKMYRLLLS